MSRKPVLIAALACLLGGKALSEVPVVAVDIAPIHSLAARVMEGVGTPVLILQPGASPHEYSLRPSEAAALQDAEIVIWMGADLTPWMETAVETLSDGARVLTLLEQEATMRLALREGALFEAHDHDEEDPDHEEHSHDDATGEPDAHGGEDGVHAHGALDPHAWLAPSNAAVWLDLIAAELSAADAGNAPAYRANAAAARSELEALVAEVDAILGPVRGQRFIGFHDAYQYFERDFDMPASGAIALGDAADPGPARVAEIRARVRAEGIACVLAEPQFNPGLVETVLDGTEARTAVIDPLGATLDPGPELYPRLIRDMAEALARCLEPRS